MEIKKLADLHTYQINEETRSITPSEFTRLKDDLTKRGQLKNLLVTPDGLIIGGNHRYKAMQELGWTEVRCDTIEFLHEEEGWYAVVQGEPQRSEFFPSEEAVKFFYSLKDNDNTYATYITEKVMTYVDTYGIPYNEIKINVEPIPSFAQVVNSAVNVDKVEEETKGKTYTCPKCGEQFTL